MHRRDLIRKLCYRYENMHVLKGPSSMAATLMWQKMIYWFRKAREFICVHSCWKYFQGTVFLFSLEVMGLEVHFEIVAVFVSCIFNTKKNNIPRPAPDEVSSKPWIQTSCVIRRHEDGRKSNCTWLQVREWWRSRIVFELFCFPQNCLKRMILNLAVSSYLLSYHLEVKSSMSRSGSSSLEFVGP